MQGLYAIVDTATLHRRHLPIVGVVEAVVRAQPAALQLRAKDLLAREMLDLLRAIHPICRNFGVPLFANDRPDLAVLAGCEGVHLGQDDLPVDIARRMAPHLRIGVSTHTLSQIDEAVAHRPDYVAYGPIFATHSKANPDEVVGMQGLSAAVRRCHLPVVAIGGVDLAHADEVGRESHLGAVIAALIPEGITPDDLSPITQRARDLHAALATPKPRAGALSPC